jgi:hypothetical protein
MSLRSQWLERMTCDKREEGKEALTGVTVESECSPLILGETLVLSIFVFTLP